MTEPLARLGLHYYPDDLHYTQADLEGWLPVLQSLRARWLVMRGSVRRGIPEPFLRGLLEAGLEPIVHLPACARPSDLSGLQMLLRSYANWGVRYVAVGDRVNMRSTWDSVDWAHGHLPDRFLDAWLPVLHAQRSAGLTPMLPPLEPGGDYWDLAFLGGILHALLRRGEQALLEQMAFGAYAWTHAHPLDWGLGGPARWPEARPYQTPEGTQDHRGLRLPEWYRAVIENETGLRRPILVLGGGVWPAESAGPLDPDPAQSRTLAVLRLLLDPAFCPGLIAFGFHLLAADADSPDAGRAWFAGPESPSATAAAVLRAVALAEQAASAAPAKPIQHYLLLSSTPGASLDPSWSHVADFIARHRPALGFSPEEASHAARVTLAAQDDSACLALEDQLRAAGCVVERLPASVLSPAQAAGAVPVDDPARAPAEVE